jgi:hypothetical protein
MKPMAEHDSLAIDPRQRRQARRLALLLGAVAIAIYVSYVMFALHHGHA